MCSVIYSVYSYICTVYIIVTFCTSQPRKVVGGSWLVNYLREVDSEKGGEVREGRRGRGGGRGATAGAPLMQSA